MPLPDDIIRRMARERAEVSKVRQREEINRQIKEYLARGGEITVVPTGYQTENMVNFTKEELIEHHKQRTRRIRGSE